MDAGTFRIKMCFCVFRACFGKKCLGGKYNILLEDKNASIIWITVPEEYLSHISMFNRTFVRCRNNPGKKVSAV